MALPQAASPAVRDFGTFFIHRPANLSHAQQASLVLACCGKAMETSTTLDQQADQSGFVVVYLVPSRTYNDVARARGPGPPFPDTLWISGVIDQVLASENGDPKRVFMTGVSSGGTLSYRVACDLPNKVAAIASVSGLDVVPGCKPTRPVSVIEIHGTADGTIPFNGRPGFLSMPQVAAKWRAIDGCSAASTVTTSRNLRDELWSNCNAKTAVELAAIIGGDHGWARSPTFDTGGAVWKFLNAHPLASSTPTAKAKASLVRVRVVYKPTRRVLASLDLGQSSSLNLTVTRRNRTIAKRTVSVAKSGVSTVSIRFPRSAKPGAYTLRIVVHASGSQITLKRSLLLRR